MRTLTKYLILGLLTLLTSLGVACIQSEATSTPKPTFTPAPTATPTPTNIPIPPPTPKSTSVPTPTPEPTATPTPTPTPVPILQAEPGNQVLPIFQKPFTGDFWLTNFFDHNLPFQFKDQNGFQLTWWNERSYGIDGHNGYDWAMPEGTPLLAVADGEVIIARSDSRFFCPILDRDVSDQQFVEILHAAPNGERLSSVYVHLSRIDVQRGQRVRAGQQIALSGNTGCSTGPHLHFHVWRLTNTNSGKRTRIDPYGWEGSGPDPWHQHPEGAQSIWLWKEGQAPLVFRETHLSPNPNPGDGAPVTITTIRLMGWKDDVNPNNEFVRLELDPRFASAGVHDLTGFRIRNLAGDSFQFPDGYVIRQDQAVKTFTGSGTNTETELYWDLSQGVWDNMGDCAQLSGPDGRRMYHLYYGPTC